MAPRSWLNAALWLCACTGTALADAPPGNPRDPTLAPAEVRAAIATPDGRPAELPALRHLMVVDGIRYVVDQGRRRKVGDTLGDARIERIEDAAVVVRQGGTLQRLPLYEGVVKRPLAEPGAAPASAALTRPTRPVMTRPARPQRPGETR